MSSSKNHSLELFKEALAYQVSADRLYEQLAPQPRIGLPLSDPVYFLYHHAAELALKACLRSHNLRPGKAHGVGELFQRCRTTGLLGIDDEHRDMHNLLVVLDGGRDEGRGYRYASRNGFVPELEWVQEAVRKLMADVKPHLENWAKSNGIADPWDPNTVTRLRYALSKPTFTKQPKPLKPGP
jgi:HEPN domain-containing protein